MTSTVLSALACTVLTWTTGPAQAQGTTFPITIDATALTVPAKSLVVQGVLDAGFTGSTTVQLSPRNWPYMVGHVVNATATGAWAAVYFTVNASGTVDYDAKYDGYVSGRGTSTLQLRGYPLHLETRLTNTSQWRLQSIVDSKLAAMDLRLLPATYAFATTGGSRSANVANRFDFVVDTLGHVQLAPETATFASGSGTNTLSVTGVQIGIHSRVETNPSGSGVVYVSETTNRDIAASVLPGAYTYGVYAQSSIGGYYNLFPFTVTAAGTITLGAGAEAYVSGGGTSAITINGFPIRFDMQKLAGATTFNLVQLRSWPKSSAVTINLLPGPWSLSAGSQSFDFQVTAAGAVAYDASLDDVLFGRGTSHLNYGVPVCTQVSDCVTGEVCVSNSCVDDVTLPVVTLGAWPRYVASAQQSLSAVVTDNGALASVTVKLGGVVVASPVPGPGGTLNVALTLAPGDNLFEVYAVDQAGNTTIKPAPVFLDTAPPSVTVLSPVSGDTLGTATVAVSVRVADASPVFVNIAGQSVLPDAQGVASATVTLAASGVNTIPIVATDAAGNKTTVTTPVFVDVDAPGLKADVAEGVLFGKRTVDTLTFNVTVTDVGATTLTNLSTGVKQKLPRGGDVAMVSFLLSAGVNTLSVSVTNEGGHEATLVRTVSYDPTPPVLTVASPAEGAALRGTAELSVDATDALSVVTAVSYQLDGGLVLPAVAAQGGAWIVALDTTTLADGAHSVAFTAVDTAGNLASVTQGFVVDNTAPTVVLDAPIEGAYVRGVVVLAASATDATSGITALTLAVNGSVVATCPADLCSFALDTTTLPSGPFTVTASAVDAAGNAAVPAHLGAIIDNEAITGFLVSPTAGAVVKSTLKVAVSTADPSFQQVDCRMDGVPLGSSQNRYFVQNVLLTQVIDGALEVACTVRDLAGNEGTESRTVQVRRWTENFRPHELRLRDREHEGDRDHEAWVTMSVSGPDVSLLLPAGPRALTIAVPGGARVPVSLGRPHGTEDDGDCDEKRNAHLDFKFARAAFVASVKAAVALRAIDPKKPVTVTLYAGDHAIGSDTIRVNP